MLKALTRLALGLALALTPATALAAPRLDEMREVNQKDNNSIEHEEFVRLEFTIRLVFYDTRQEWEQAAKSYGEVATDGIYAFSRVWLDKPVCEVHIVDPRRRYRPEWFGHEGFHCAFGRYHEEK